MRRRGDGDQQLVARPVAHRVVDELEVVEVDEEDPHDAALVGGGERPLDPVPEQHPVREPGERVVERPVGELVLQLPLIGDVPQGEHDPADGRIVPEVAGGHLDVDARRRPCAGSGSRGCRRLRAPRPAGRARRRRGRPGATRSTDARPDQYEPGPSIASADGLAYRMRPPSSTIRMTSWAFCTSVRKYASLLRRVTSWLSVTRSTASAACDASTSRAPRRVSEHRLVGGDDEEPHRRPGGGPVGRDERARPARSRTPSISRAATPSRSSTCRSRLARPGCPQRDRAHRRGLAVDEQHRPVRRARREQAADRRAHGCGHVGGVGGRHQVVAGRAQGALTLDGLPVPCHHAGQAGQDEQEQQGGGRGDHRPVRRRRR